MEVITQIFGWLNTAARALNLVPSLDSAAGIFCILVWISTLLALGLFAISFFADLGGGDADVSGDLDGDTGHFSVRTIIGFMLGFSWGGFVCIQSGMSTAGSVGVGVLVGLFMFLLIAQLMRFIYGLRSDGSLDYKTLVGMKGTVYVTIPPHGEPGGQVQVAHPSQLVTMQAIQYGDHPLPAQTRIIVTEANTLQLVVRSLDEPAPGPSPQSGDAAPSPDR
ncbi:MAG TPA: hypothetical protein H9976_02310 [Candidatus Akkermansia intestinavium]|nr:hypothetical protein [Candidatus Akkermansia intestinavium]